MSSTQASGTPITTMPSRTPGSASSAIGTDERSSRPTGKCRPAEKTSTGRIRPRISSGTITTGGKALVCGDSRP